MVREICTAMKKQNKKIEIESEREALQGRDEALIRYRCRGGSQRIPAGYGAAVRVGREQTRPDLFFDMVELRS
jgi:hypothetical protein